MVLLVVGTLSQKNLGVHAAQEMYFLSWWLWVVGVIPLPGGMTTISLIFVNLMTKMFVEGWSLRNLGTIVTHLSVLLLIFGGFLTAQFSYEGNMVIRENESSNHISDYHKLELIVKKDGRDVLHLKEKAFEKGMKIEGEFIPFRIYIKHFYRNSDLKRRENLSGVSDYKGFIEKFKFEEKPLDKQDGRNISSLVFDIDGAGGADGRYGIFESMPIEQGIVVADSEYMVELRHERTILPFSIKLLDFEKKVHPATNMPKGFKSDIILEDQGVAWRSRIEMNKPLRYKGYTFYQSSYVQDGAGEVTVLTVVRNMGRLFPYISSIMMCIGLLMHMWIIWVKIPPFWQNKK